MNELLRCLIDTGHSNQEWFNNTYLYNPNVQYGFTIVGQGYVHGGVFGIAILAALEGALTRQLYRLCSKDKYGFIIYAYTVPLIIYSTRADFGNIISPMLKYAIGVTLIVMFLERSGFFQETNV